MSKVKFQVGDEVRVNKPMGIRSELHGHVGTIVEIDEGSNSILGHYFWVFIDDQRVGLWSFHLELVEAQLTFPFMRW